MDEYKGSPALDAGLISAAQAVEHYEITRYGTFATWADELGNSEGAKLLKATLAEEEDTDKALSDLAERRCESGRPGRKLPNRNSHNGGTSLKDRHSTVRSAAA